MVHHRSQREGAVMGSLPRPPSSLPIAPVVALGNADDLAAAPYLAALSQPHRQCGVAIHHQGVWALLVVIIVKPKGRQGLYVCSVLLCMVGGHVCVLGLLVVNIVRRRTGPGCLQHTVTLVHA